ncbi:hypothetical protein IWQ60_008812 [Tieghemiomyces parasiticus]|uniref:Uncharacterized protein n=1 Tax=Tieghemiomyces parasiticus TaxID=78921 RepID=A0A9W7ZRD5_9FUNG|nr:hypothetical protein IWQ60_008812 [Tieghemiomyces parasiticus]
MIAFSRPVPQVFQSVLRHHRPLAPAVVGRTLVHQRSLSSLRPSGRLLNHLLTHRAGLTSFGQQYHHRHLPTRFAGPFAVTGAPVRHVASTSEKAALKRRNERVSEVKGLDDPQLTLIYTAPAAETMDVQKRNGSIFFFVALLAIPYIVYAYWERAYLVIPAFYAAIMPLSRQHWLCKRLVTRMWLVNDKSGRLPRGVRETFTAHTVNQRAPLFPEQLVRIEIYSFWGKNHQYVVPIGQLKLDGLKGRRDRWAFRDPVDVNGKRLPKFLLLDYEIDQKSFAQLRILKHQIASHDEIISG